MSEAPEQPHEELLELDEDGDPCWCGVENPYFDDEVFDRPCGGSGTLNCYCGGDFCVCHWHGEVECPGCEDCEDDEGCDWDED